MKFGSCEIGELFWIYENFTNPSGNVCGCHPLRLYPYCIESGLNSQKAGHLNRNDAVGIDF